MQRLTEGGAPDVVAACREYERIASGMALAQGDSSVWHGSACEMPPEALRFFYRHTAEFTPMSFGEWDFTSALRGVSAPLLVIYGERDPAGIPFQRAWARSVPNGRLLLVSRAGKGAIGDRPDLVAEAIDQFLSGHWPSSAVRPS
jgi:pimeloyl-ACP methyl ester carboxylesterase